MVNNMKIYTIDHTLVFSFPDNWRVEKCDTWAFYRNFSRIRSEEETGVKCVDLIAIYQSTLWLIEVKDYRLHRRKKKISPDKEFCQKIFDTLAMLLPASCNAIENEKIIAKEALQIKKIRAVLHYEQPSKAGKLFPVDFDLNDMQLKIRQRIKSIDPHPIVMDMHRSPPGMVWDVSSARM